MIRTTQAAFLVAPEPQRDAAMRAELVHQSVAPFRVTERDQLFRQQAHTHRRTVILGQFLNQQRWDPVAPKQLTHRRSRTRPSEQIILFLAKHRRILRDRPIQASPSRRDRLAFTYAPHRWLPLREYQRTTAAVT